MAGPKFQDNTIPWEDCEAKILWFFLIAWATDEFASTTERTMLLGIAQKCKDELIRLIAAYRSNYGVKSSK